MPVSTRLLVGLMFCGISTLFIVIGVVQAWTQERRLNTFIAVPARVTATGTASHRGSKGRSYFTPAVDFRYVVDDHEHTGHAAEAIAGHHSRADAQAIADRFPVGAQVTAWRSPSDPDDAYLLREASFFPYLLILFPMLHFCAGLAALLSPWLGRNAAPGARARATLAFALFWNGTGLLAFAHYLVLANGRLDGLSGTCLAIFTLIGAAVAWHAWRTRSTTTPLGAEADPIPDATKSIDERDRP